MARHRKIAAGAFLAGAAAFCPAGPAAAQEEAFDTGRLAACMVENAQETDRQIMRDLIIAALQDDVPAMRTGVISLGAAMVQLATASCGMGFSELQRIDFEKVGQAFGEILATQMMEEAFSKLQ